VAVIGEHVNKLQNDTIRIAIRQYIVAAPSRSKPDVRRGDRLTHRWTITKEQQPLEDVSHD
jgi:hypothetical protein